MNLPININQLLHGKKEGWNPAIENNLVKLTILDKPQSSKQKYRLTSYENQVIEESK